ncbi:MAG: hypothetical protein HKO85_05365 [Xanthomonadales bacterium]|nr:hypothetical protein [Xanthomonadales bacterium]
MMKLHTLEYPVSGARRVLVFAFLVALLSSCASAPKDEDGVVVKRAQERWEAVVTGDLETAYTYFAPGYRSSHSLIDYGVLMRTRKVTYISAEYMDHSCEERRCIVRFRLGFRVFAPVPGMTKYDGMQVVEDTWIKTSGEWWYLPKK